jgi:uncharacterized membrane protein YdjX (TVP38/TMEM64 family)
VTTPATASGPRWVWLRLAGFVVVAVLGTAALATSPLDTATVRAEVVGAGAWGWLVFVGAYVVATLVLLPKNVLSVAAGLVFGPALGTALVWCAAVLGAVAAFWLGRALGRDGVARLAGSAMTRLDRWVEHQGVWAVLVARLVPVLPFTAVNYAAGLTAIGFWPYLLATAVGILPGTVAYVAIGAYGSEPGSWPFVIAVGALVLLAAGGAVWRYRARRNGA